MDPDPQESFSDSEPTYQAFDSSKVRPSKERSLLTPPETEERPGTPSGPRTRRPSGSGPPAAPVSWPTGRRGSVPTDEQVTSSASTGSSATWATAAWDRSGWSSMSASTAAALKVIKADVAETRPTASASSRKPSSSPSLSEHPNAVVVYDTGLWASSLTSTWPTRRGRR